MRRNRFTAPAKAALAIALLVFFAGMLKAATTVIDPVSGDLLTVALFVDGSDPSLQGVRLLVQRSGGQTDTETIPSTYDENVDQEPVIALKPSGGVVVVWSRKEGSNFDLAMARRGIGGGWTWHDILTTSPKDDEQPRLLVDSLDQAHILWWGDGVGGPVYLQTFDIPSGQAVGPKSTPFDDGQHSGKGKKLFSTSSDPDSAGGMDDPGVVTATVSVASAEECVENPAAAPDHGLVMSCGNPAPFQLTRCQLVVATYNNSLGGWDNSVANLSNVSLSNTSVREIVQSLADARCN